MKPAIIISAAGFTNALSLGICCAMPLVVKLEIAYQQPLRAPSYFY
jgi:hypothetical protein